MFEKQERYYAEGPDVHDRENPELICGFLAAETAIHAAEDFNNRTPFNSAEDYAWWRIDEEGTIYV